MNPELPKSIRSVLSQKGTMTTHPSADVLTAFAERTLTAGENERVADHLAGCLECREVLFLASDVDEGYMTDSEWVAKIDLRSRPRWMPRLAWIAPGVVAIAIAGGILLHQYLASDTSHKKITQVAQVAPQPSRGIQEPETAEPTAAAKVDSPPHTVKAKPSETAKVSHKGSATAAMEPPSPNAPEPPAMTKAPPAKAVNQPPGSVVGGSANNFQASVPMQNSFAEHTEGRRAKSLAPDQLQGAPMALMRQGAPIKVWRVTAVGHLEHLTQSGWTSVLADRPVRFTAVAASPNGVWAGGSHGELFHSEDGGAQWNEVALPIPSDGKDDPLVSIYFADLLHGNVLAQTGTRYTTSDGGKNWQRD